MSLQWEIVEKFLYFEIFLTLLFLFLPTSWWKRILHSQLVSKLRSRSYLYFSVAIVGLLLLCVDSGLDVRKYMGRHDQMSTLPHASESSRNLNNMKMFRAERNCYIAGFALFLWIILRRIVILQAEEVRLIANVEAGHKQARSATDIAKQLVEDHDNKAKRKWEFVNQHEEEGFQTKAELRKAQTELSKSLADLDTVRKQAQSTSAAYNRLLKEHAGLQTKIN